MKISHPKDEAATAETWRVGYTDVAPQSLLLALGHTVHCLGHGFKSGLPIGPFLSEMFIVF